MALAAFEAVVAHARSAAPEECCGVLLGAADRIAHALPAPNVSPTPTTCFVLDPGAHVAARRWARTRGLLVVGFYHSHPASAPVPSPTDVAEWRYPEALCAIVGLAGAGPELRLFRLAGGDPEELGLDVA